MGICPNRVNELLRARNIPAGGAKRLRECAHENINVPRINTKVVAHAAPVWTNRPYRVSFVDKEVELDGICNEWQPKKEMNASDFTL